MNDNQRRKLDKFKREARFMADNAADFPASSPGNLAALEKNAIIDEIETLAAQQISGTDSARQHHSVKDELVDDLMEMIRDINRAANAFGDEVPGVEQKFRLPRNRSEQNLIATAQSFLADAATHKAKFIEYGLDADFLDDLQAQITAVKNTNSDAGSAVDTQSAATGGIVDALQRGMTNSRKLDAIVKIKYRNNPAKLSAWAVASHLERSPKRASQPSPPPVQ